MDPKHSRTIASEAGIRTRRAAYIYLATQLTPTTSCSSMIGLSYRLKASVFVLGHVSCLPSFLGGGLGARVLVFLSFLLSGFFILSFPPDFLFNPSQLLSKSRRIKSCEMGLERARGRRGGEGGGGWGEERRGRGEMGW